MWAVRYFLYQFTLSKTAQFKSFQSEVWFIIETILFLQHGKNCIIIAHVWDCVLKPSMSALGQFFSVMARIASSLPAVCELPSCTEIICINSLFCTARPSQFASILSHHSHQSKSTWKKTKRHKKFMEPSRMPSEKYNVSNGLLDHGDFSNSSLFHPPFA